MNDSRSIFHTLLAVAIGVGTIALYWDAGWGAAGALLLGALLATIIFSIIGGRTRIVLVSIATVLPFVVSQTRDFLWHFDRASFGDALSQSAPTAAGAFGILVAVPVAVVSAVHYFRCRR